MHGAKVKILTTIIIFKFWAIIFYVPRMTSNSTYLTNFQNTKTKHNRYTVSSLHVLALPDDGTHLMHEKLVR